MKKTVFKSSLKKRKEMLREIVKTDRSWKFRMLLTVILFSAAALIVIAIAVLLVLNPTDIIGIAVFTGAAIGLACAPFFIALSTKNTAKYKCAYPYSSYANGTLILDEQNLQYLFWQVGPTEPAAYSSPRAVYNDEDKFVYQISRNDISNLVIDENGICTIFGDGKITVPEWADSIPKSEVNALSKEFSFVLAFDEANVKESIMNWRNSNG